MMPNNAAANNVAVSPRLRGEVLKQIYRVWLLRKLVPVLLVEIGILALVLYQLARFVFFQRIAENAMNVFFSSPLGIVRFFGSAFVQTPLATKLLIISLAILIAFVIRHVTQGILRFILVKQNFFGKIQK